MIYTIKIKIDTEELKQGILNLKTDLTNFLGEKKTKKSGADSYCEWGEMFDVINNTVRVLEGSASKNSAILSQIVTTQQILLEFLYEKETQLINGYQYCNWDAHFKTLDTTAIYLVKYYSLTTPPYVARP